MESSSLYYWRQSTSYFLLSTFYLLLLPTDWMLARVTVSRKCGDQMADPPEHAAAAYPQARSHNKPENAPEYLPVVDLTNTWNKEAQNGCCAWISHIFLSMHSTINAR